MKVLIIDDEKALLTMYQDKMKTEGFEVVTAVDGEEGLDKAITTKPDVILLDIIMPKLNGLDVLKQFKASDETKDIPVYLLTNIPEVSAKKGEELGAAGYLFKAETEPSKLVDFLKGLTKK